MESIIIGGLNHKFQWLYCHNNHWYTYKQLVTKLANIAFTIINNVTMYTISIKDPHNPFLN